MKTLLLYNILGICFLAGLGQIYIRTQSTLLGYKIGTLKNKEQSLLKKKSSLVAEFARITTKANLLEITNIAKNGKNAGQGKNSKP